jgi:uncharacterized SAM-dependent methyltransferase
MHLRSTKTQMFHIEEAKFTFRSDETIWTESCHKYGRHEARKMAERTGFECVAQWMDEEWAFAENLFVAI